MASPVRRCRPGARRRDAPSSPSGARCRRFRPRSRSPRGRWRRTRAGPSEAFARKLLTSCGAAGVARTVPAMAEVAAHAEQARSVPERVLADRWLLGAIGLWRGCGALLGLVVGRVTDWFVMTDELLYERLAISVAQSWSPVPHVHGQTIGNLNQLYPVLIAPFFGGGSTPGSLHDAHLL